jgi:acyl-CoA thioester hydrolase
VSFSHDARDRLPNLTPRTSPIDLMAFAIPHSHPFTCDIRITSDQLSGLIPHVSNIEYVRWLDRAAELHADSLGYTRDALMAAGVMWFVARHEIDYCAEAWLDDELIIATWVRDMRKVKSWRDFLIVRPRDETVICRASTLWVLVNLETRRPQRISLEMVRRFAPLQTDLPPHATASRPPT